MITAHQTLTDPDRRKEYDDFLLTTEARNRDYQEIDPEEVERRKRERGKKRFMDDFDFINEDFYGMWKERTA